MEDLRRHFERQLDQGIEAHQRTRETLLEDAVRACERLTRCVARGGKILACGNGGSASEAQHFVAELVGRFERDRPPMPAIALTAETASLTSIANDDGYDRVFAQQVRALGQPGDTLVVLSTSGNSASVLAAVDAAQEGGITVIALTGRDGGKLAAHLDDRAIELRVPAQRTARIQEVHLTLIHCLCDGIDEHLHPKDASA